MSVVYCFLKKCRLKLKFFIKNYKNLQFFATRGPRWLGPC